MGTTLLRTFELTDLTTLRYVAGLEMQANGQKF
jgi:hypothetical protein